MKDKILEFTNYNFCVYLIGSMESPAINDGGVGWRQTLTPELDNRNIYVFNPTREEIEKVGMPTGEFMEKLEGLLEKGRKESFREQMGKIWRGVSQLKKNEETKSLRLFHILGDIDYVERSRFLIWNFKAGDKCGGTILELAIAWYRGIPVYLVTDVPISKLNKSLLYAVLDSGHGEGNVFKNNKQLLKYIDNKYDLKPKK